jgi:ribosomal protein S18 acetylase RimI-like enzyme
VERLAKLMKLQGDQEMVLAPSAEESVASFLQQRMSDDSSETWVAEQRGRVIGYCLAVVTERPLVFLERRYGKIIDLAVTSEYRRRGVGRALVEHAREWFRGQGVDSIELNVATSNDVGRAFWKSLWQRRMTLGERFGRAWASHRLSRLTIRCSRS